MSLESCSSNLKSQISAPLIAVCLSFDLIQWFFVAKSFCFNISFLQSNLRLSSHMCREIHCSVPSRALYILSPFHNWVIQLIVALFTCTIFCRETWLNYTAALFFNLWRQMKMLTAPLLHNREWTLRNRHRLFSFYLMSYFPDFTVSNSRNDAHHRLILTS